MIHLAGDFAELVLHLWAHVRAPGPGNAFDPRYVAWSRGVFDASTQRRLEQDAGIVGARWSNAMFRWPWLHHGLDEFANTAAQELAHVGPDQVADPGALRSLQAIDDPVTEVVHASLSLLVDGWRDVYGREVTPALRWAQAEVAARMPLAVAVAPELGRRRVELSWALGPRGRAMSDRIVVGAPAAWNRQAPIASVVIALHEHAVLESDAADHFQAEWRALCVNAARTRNASDELRGAYDEWLAGLDLDEVLVHTPISVDERSALITDPGTRGARLARFAG